MSLQPFQPGEWVAKTTEPSKPLQVLEVMVWPKSPSGWVAKCRLRTPLLDLIDWVETSQLTRTGPPSGSPGGGGGGGLPHAA